MSAAARALPVDKPPETAGRYRLKSLLDARGGFERWSAEDEAGIPTVILTEPMPESPGWPGLAWEQQIRAAAAELGVAGVAERWEDAGRAFLSLESPTGVTLWDVWDEPALGTSERYGRLIELAKLLHRLHAA